MADVGELKRGDLVYVRNTNLVGHEIRKDRPAVIVSNPNVCRHAPMLQVVYTSRKKYDGKPYHVQLNNGTIALCEQLYTVDVMRLEWKGKPQPPEIMRKINDALAQQLQLDDEHRI